ncbi:hypothetical protein AVEN_63436-1 [Araneus ventricosus]|uniref:Uncharacterized protein n=1 Tax=Araneus ventricosus TaxID=182803 RepID=A0A4Y2BBW3_ARAVE|nr:hypothetical protein AVEN_63436-1 [Araneus ventricosus]
MHADGQTDFPLTDFNKNLKDVPGSKFDSTEDPPYIRRRDTNVHPSFTTAPHHANPSTTSQSDNLSPSSSSSSMDHTLQAPLASTYLFPPHLWPGNPNGMLDIKQDIHRCCTPRFLEYGKAKPFVNVKSR